MMLLLPTHRDRPSSAMYPAAVLENGQLPSFQPALFHQVIGACKPCSDPNLSVAEKGIVSLSPCPLPAGAPILSIWLLTLSTSWLRLSHRPASRPVCLSRVLTNSCAHCSTKAA
uniref:Uncharacterized protein n=1 Tax=Myotis myotis TaxID=51298 RepID=A0A7J7UCX6_MYOMY|nr:hypothetical protein mMyoMyo1_008798 [Myotis myotis]